MCKLEAGRHEHEGGTTRLSTGAARSIYLERIMFKKGSPPPQQLTVGGAGISSHRLPPALGTTVLPTNTAQRR